MEREFAVKLTGLMACKASASRRGKGRGISPTPDPGEETLASADPKDLKELHLLRLARWASVLF